MGVVKLFSSTRTWASQQDSDVCGGGDASESSAAWESGGSDSMDDGLAWDSDSSKTMSDSSVGEGNLSERGSRAWDSEGS